MVVQKTLAQRPPPPKPRYDILCVFVIENSKHIGFQINALYDNIIKRVFTKLRQQIPPEDSTYNSKTSPCVKLGVVYFGDYEPYSEVTCEAQHFLINYRQFEKNVKSHAFTDTGLLRVATIEGLVGALEMFDEYDEHNPEVNITVLYQRHCFLISTTPPYLDPCRCNKMERYDGYTFQDVAARMKE
ncbi:hypothetical protein EV182_005889, partial [Spiromyces aspiralis]